MVPWFSISGKYYKRSHLPGLLLPPSQPESLPGLHKFMVHHQTGFLQIQMFSTSQCLCFFSTNISLTLFKWFNLNIYQACYSINCQNCVWIVAYKSKEKIYFNSKCTYKCYMYHMHYFYNYVSAQNYHLIHHFLTA